MTSTQHKYTSRQQLLLQSRSPTQPDHGTAVLAQEEKHFNGDGSVS
ncbi:hypothetical protein MtrunA17_Chr3g0097901 [Medicago truncatula]|uniref:Uncharacterized protein n=1 Tax=Medicago truncatula TaxID=3880 RepID=A0A396IQM5_MEDTR|nr:hypothetical protein MtrunA17_Chr3g0097901 [Medicago truncatula]